MTMYEKLIICLILNVVLFTNALTVVDSADINENSVDQSQYRYDPTWESLDQRPIPSWYDNAKIGIFLHWGVYAVPSFGSEWFWINWQGYHDEQYIKFMEKNYKPGYSYQDFGSDFTTELFNPYDWAELFQASGAKYVVLTSKHHDGYTLWPSKYSFSWNSQDVGPHRDLVGELASAIRANTSLHFGLYHSLYEWYNRLYLEDKKNNFKTQVFVDNKVLPEMRELIETYKPDVLWSDGDWETVDTYWRSRDFIAWLYNDSPVKDTIVVNDRWGSEIPCKHGDFYTCTDRYNPGILQPHKWENAMTLDKGSWGYRKNAKLADYMTQKELLKELAMTISCGGNILINVGPNKEGTIDIIFEERLRDLGTWLKWNGEAVYGSQPWLHQNDTLTSYVWFTQPLKPEDTNVVYAFVLEWPKDDVLTIAALHQYVDTTSTIQFLELDKKLEFYKTEKEVKILFPNKALLKTNDSWVLKITYKK